MNEIVLRGRPFHRMAAIGLIIFMLIFSLAPALLSFDCEGRSSQPQRFKCEVSKVAGPFFALALVWCAAVPMRNFLLGRPVLTLTREGIAYHGYKSGLVAWHEIKEMAIVGYLYGRRLQIRTAYRRELPPYVTIWFILKDLVDDGQRWSLISQFQIDRPLEAVAALIEQGRKHAASGLSPDPLFTSVWAWQGLGSAGR